MQCAAKHQVQCAAKRRRAQEAGRRQAPRTKLGAERSRPEGRSPGLVREAGLGLGGVVDEGGEEPGEALRGRDDARAEERPVP